MLIVCSGEDSYQSLEKARSLEAAYKEKYDLSGSSVERLASGKDGIDPLLSLTSGASLFSTRRFVRVDGVVSSCPKARKESLMKMLSRDVESTIIVSVEEGELKKKDLTDFLKLPKFIHYEFPFLSPPAFTKWAMDFALKNGVKDQQCVRELIRSSQGNSWYFVNECKKIAAGGSLAETTDSAQSVYDVIDVFIQKKSDRFSRLRSFGDAQSVLAQIVNQARSFSLVKSGRAEGVHPFVARKLSSMNGSPGERFQKLVSAFLWSRTGRSSADESLDVLG